MEPKKLAIKPAYYLTRPDQLPTYIGAVLKLHEENRVDKNDLANYKYPLEYKSHFLNFVKSCLEKGKKR